MKIKFIYAYALLFSGLFLFSCSSDDSSNNPDQESEEIENTPIESSEVVSKILIEGATKEAGTPPTPNEAISFEVVSGTSALQTEGFDIAINSDTELTGAYLQIKNVDGEVANEYFDIDFSALSGKSVPQHIKKRSVKKTVQAIEVEADVEIDVDFETSLEPGTFCYVICVYDANGNISAPQEVCITVESWGGKNDLVAVWNLEKEEETYMEETYSYIVGEEICDDYNSNFSCEDDTIVEYQYCGLVDSGTLNLKVDGTYVYETSGYENELDYEASVNECKAIYVKVEDYYWTKGYWAYNAEKEEIYIVRYEYIDRYGDEEYSGTYEEGDAYVGSAKVILSGNSLIILEEDIDSSYKSYFNK
ncbi:hypothetical protein [Abyssalbus ytuae]|uniref:Uncharacterized protein n=1 Tax=Abyssalbus ytuae TaxID=2926907 RepID=A0A9E6ZI87_9FLAO|nr:hypothetical protein [Abyssalbus ytuae]UOB15989.1 hypothetical protein MQE35_09575 [Abyssalbus ytuae]